ncbi:hypothetical protein [Amycolatopsis sp. FDAARGOS 1241]|uniref:hypothetical protein n=1 Tax=Amycolatopsis sp. FDAARGOS 1241 TaxID=2778070 RepID=UPI00194E76AD|nr:hypothetical protein [Amycolatopsis sp. FDAARGOS 1241]QRP42720.1 hypothetical protein I6J71_24855 [Amycolatopsis sp. FDAARGOS 1241]
MWFAFYGRTSTVRHRDRASSQGWQRDLADHVITGHGHASSPPTSTPTSRRTHRHNDASRQLMAAITGPERAVGAIVVGEQERAFTGTQLTTLYTWCTQPGIQLWLPETAGPVDLSNRLPRVGPTETGANESAQLHDVSASHLAPTTREPPCEI